MMIRPTNIFGVSPNQRAIRRHRVHADFCRQAIADRKITIKGAPNDIRDFLPVSVLAKRAADLHIAKSGGMDLPESLGHELVSLCYHWPTESQSRHGDYLMLKCRFTRSRAAHQLGASSELLVRAGRGAS